MTLVKMKKVALIQEVNLEVAQLMSLRVKTNVASSSLGFVMELLTANVEKMKLIVNLIAK